MQLFPTPPLWRALAAALFAGLTLLAGCGDDDDAFVDVDGDAASVPPLPLPGPRAVGCSNVAQDFSRVGSASEAEAYWEGRRRPDGSTRDVSALLSDPAHTLSTTVAVPNDSTLYGSFAGSAVGYTLLVCYPTGADNPRPDYALPTGKVVPHMQTGAEAPLFADPAARYPVLAFAHGIAASPLSAEHLDVLLWLASYGYVVVAPCHADPRFADLQFDELGEVVKLLTNLSDAVAMQALRPLAMSAALDLLLSDARWREHVDAAQIGGFGASLGGETLLLMGGAALTTSPGLASRRIGTDTRLKAAVGYVPYFGQPLLPAFGRDQRGLDGVTLPYLAIAGTADTTAPMGPLQEGLARLQGSKQLVALRGVQHGFDPAWAGDILTWTLTYLDAQVRGLPDAQDRLARMTSVEGGGDDRLMVPVTASVP